MRSKEKKAVTGTPQKGSSLCTCSAGLDDLARHKGQLLGSRVRVGRHGGRVVRVKRHKQSSGGDGQLARGL